MERTPGFGERHAVETSPSLATGVPTTQVDDERVSGFRPGTDQGESMTAPTVPNVDREVLREAIQEEYDVVACEPQRGFHFHTGRPLAEILGYQPEWKIRP